MKSVAVYYFSGTGNTEIVANMIKEAFAMHEYNVSMIRMEDILKNNVKVDPQSFDLIGIGCPIIGYGVPNIVQDFIRLLPKENSKKVFVFRTAGGVAPINYNASKQMIRKLDRKGYEVFHERVFSISSNWVVRFDDFIIRQLYEVTKKKVEIMCKEIINGENRILKTGIRLRVLMELAMHIFPWILRLVGKDLIINKYCSDCGLCIKNCPSRNIYRKKGKIRFKLSCNSCMRCVYTCPKFAIKFRLLKFFPVSGGYNIETILKQPCDTSEIGSRPIPPFFNEYIQNDAL